MAGQNLRDKDPTWTRVYEFDFGAFAEVQAGELISSPVISGTTTGLTVGSPTISSALVLLPIAGGTLGTIYSLTCTVTTSGGAVLTKLGKLRIVNNPS